jgi:NADPH:quinone reductase-like Zn-dependent oxidoreductase
VWRRQAIARRLLSAVAKAGVIVLSSLLIMQPTGQVVAITGASGGIGAAAGRLLAARGDRVVLAARREEELARVAEEIAAASGEASTCVVDVTRREDLVSLVAHATAGSMRSWPTPASRRQAR